MFSKQVISNSCLLLFTNTNCLWKLWLIWQYWKGRYIILDKRDRKCLNTLYISIYTHCLIYDLLLGFLRLFYSKYFILSRKGLDIPIFWRTASWYTYTITGLTKFPFIYITWSSKYTRRYFLNKKLICITRTITMRYYKYEQNRTEVLILQIWKESYTFCLITCVNVSVSKQNCPALESLLLCTWFEFNSKCQDKDFFLNK